MAKPISFTKRDLEKKKQEKRLAKQQKKEERNFEKRGYMGKKVLGIMVILLFFTGCQNMGNESENLQQVEKQENGEIAKSRHESYVEMYEQAKQLKEWEYKND